MSDMTHPDGWMKDIFAKRLGEDNKRALETAMRISEAARRKEEAAADEIIERIRKSRRTRSSVPASNRAPNPGGIVTAPPFKPERDTRYDPPPRPKERPRTAYPASPKPPIGGVNPLSIERDKPSPRIRRTPILTPAQTKKKTSRHFVDGDNDFAVYDNEIQCNYCSGVRWCNHIKKAIEHNRDAEELWDSMDYPLEASFTFKVPMIPTHNLFAEVSLSPSDFSPDILKVELSHLAAESTHLSHFLGYFHPGEGRGILRSMIFDWFRGHIKLEDLYCKSVAHKYLSERVWQADKNTNNQLAQYWSVWYTGNCLHCNDAGAGTTDDSDLVPDLDTRRVF